MKTEDIINAMIFWAIENNLEKEFTAEILNSKHLEAWVHNNDALIKRFDYFVLEHTMVEVLYS